jgi:hypothetical protein
MTMVANVKRIIGNENGFVLGASILISAILMLAGVLALWTANTGMHIVRNEGDLTLEFYNAEGGVIDALENYDTGTMEWLTDAFLIASHTAAGAVRTSNNSGGETVATVEVRCIHDESVSTALDYPIPPGLSGPVSGLSDAANTVPHQQHIAPPPSGSGFSLKYFEVRRYGITATSATGNTRTQVGAYKVFNKY